MHTYANRVGIALIVAAAACGARSSLLEGDARHGAAGTGGAGGMTSTSSASSASSPSSASSSGAGGMPVVCTPLTLTGADLALPPLAGFHARRPAVVQLGAGPT